MGGVCHRPLYNIEDIMIVLRKENHYCHAHSREKAQELVNDGYEVIKNKLGGPKIVKEQPKKKATKKKNSFYVRLVHGLPLTLEIRRINGNIKPS